MGWKLEMGEAGISKRFKVHVGITDVTITVVGICVK